MKKYLVVIMAVLMALCLCACGKTEAVKAAEEKIAAIGDVTLDSEKRISAAEKAVEKLSDDELKQLDKAEELKKAREAYEELVLENKAAAVDSVIDQIGEVTLESAEKIAAARQEYDAAPENVKEKVKGLAVLESAENALIQLRAQGVEGLIDQIGEVTLESAEKINAAQQAFEQLTEKEKGKVKNASLLNQAEENCKSRRRRKSAPRRLSCLGICALMKIK